MYCSWTVSTRKEEEEEEEEKKKKYYFLFVFHSINQAGLAEAAEYLVQAFYGFEAPLVKVTCQTEVSEQYHVYLQTRQQSKDMCIAAIEQYTHTTIQFPTMINTNLLQDNTNNHGRRTSVTISGTATQVCQARKLFDVKKLFIFFFEVKTFLSVKLCLPVILNFEIPTDKEPTRGIYIYIYIYIYICIPFKIMHIFSSNCSYKR